MDETESRKTLFDIVKESLGRLSQVRIENAENYVHPLNGKATLGEIVVEYGTTQKPFFFGLFTRTVPACSLDRIYEALKSTKGIEEVHYKGSRILCKSPVPNGNILYNKQTGAFGTDAQVVVVTENPFWTDSEYFESCREHRA